MAHPGDGYRRVRFYCEAIIFDLDGVLVDSRSCVERHWRRWATQKDLDPASVLAVAHGRRNQETIATVAPHLDAATEGAALTRAQETDTEGIVEIPGARALVASLPRETWAIATSGSRLTAATRIAHVELPAPAVLVAAEDVHRGKPAPDPFLTAADRLGRRPDACLAVEDAPPGIVAARSAGMRAIGIASTHPTHALAEADAVVLRLLDIQVAVDDSEHGSRLLVTADIVQFSGGGS